jgi:hypothetical protein
MTDMLKEGRNSCFLGPFLPIPAMKPSFARLYDAFTKAPVLAPFDPAKPIHFETDASGFAIIGIISQQHDKVYGVAEGAVRSAKGNQSASKGRWHPVALWTRSMSLTKPNYTIGNQEMLSIVMSCDHWRHYLEGARQPVEVLTDHHNLQRLMTTKSLTACRCAGVSRSRAITST